MEDQGAIVVEAVSPPQHKETLMNRAKAIASVFVLYTALTVTPSHALECNDVILHLEKNMEFYLDKKENTVSQCRKGSYTSSHDVKAKWMNFHGGDLAGVYCTVQVLYTLNGVPEVGEVSVDMKSCALLEGKKPTMQVLV